MSRHEAKIAAGAQPYLGPGERVLASAIVRPNGIGVTGDAPAGDWDTWSLATSAGFGLVAPMAIALTDRRFLMLRIGTPVGLGIGGAVRGLLGEIPVERIVEMHAQMLRIGRSLFVTSGPVRVYFAGNIAADLRGIAAAFAGLASPPPPPPPPPREREDDRERTALIGVLESARTLLLRPDNDFTWSSWRDAEHALAEVDGHLKRLRAGGALGTRAMAIVFLPTGPLQEVAVSSGWGDAFLELADRFDAVAALDDA
jgi:hypothetical protein